MNSLVLGESLDALLDHRGKTPKKLGGDFVSSGVPVASALLVRDGRLDLSEARYVTAEMHMRWMPERTARGDVILTSEAPAGKVARVVDDSPLVLGQRLFGLRGTRGVLDSGFLYYALQSHAVQSAILGHSTGTTVVGIRQSALRQVRIPAPPFAEQQAIAEVLGALDDKIAANTALAATAELAVTTAHSAAMRGEVTERALLKELSIEFGEPFRGAQFSEPGVGRPLIRIRDLKTFSSQIWTTESRSNEVVVVAGDVLVGMDAEFRATPWLGEPGVLNQRVLRASHGTYGRALVREMLKRPLTEVEGEKSATTVIHLNKSDLARKTVLVPSSDALNAFERLAEPLYESRIALAAENRTLAATRDALLPQLMSGKLRVRDAEAAASRAGD